MKKNVLIVLLCVATVSIQMQAKTYKYKFEPPFEIEQVRVAKQGLKFVQSWAECKNADKAIILAKQNAVAAMLFTGISSNDVMGAGVVPPLFLEGTSAYEKHKDYFDNFFKKGEFLKYAIDVNSTYPTGQNNIQTPKGRKVGIYLQLLYDDLRNRLIDEGMIKAMGDQFRF